MRLQRGRGRWRWIAPLVLGLLTLGIAWRWQGASRRRAEAPLEPVAASSLRSVTGLVRGAWQGVVGESPEATELSRLREALALLRLEHLQLRESVERSARRGATLEFGTRRLRRLITVGVLARDPALWFKSATIDAGLEEGVKTDAGVLSALGVVGKVVNAGQKSARVVFVTDPQFRAAARDARSKVEAIAVGDGRRALRLDYLSGQDDVKVGDLIETSAGVSFPSGVPLGTVSRVVKTDNGLRLSVEVEPAASFSRLDALWVVGDSQ